MYLIQRNKDLELFRLKFIKLQPKLSICQVRKDANNTMNTEWARSKKWKETRLAFSCHWFPREMVVDSEQSSVFVMDCASLYRGIFAKGMTMGKSIYKQDLKRKMWVPTRHIIPGSYPLLSLRTVPL